MKFGLLFLFSILSITSHAQKLYRISLQEQKVDLDGAQIFIDAVIDERQNKSSFGWVQKGHAKRFVIFDNPFEKEILDFLKKSLPAKSVYTPIRIGVEYLHIDELSKTFEGFAKADLSLIFYAQNQEGKWFPVGKKNANSERRGFDATKKHPENIALTFEKAINAFLNSPWKESIGSDKNLRLTAKVDLHSLPVYMDETYPSGIYRTFDEFVRNKPGIIDHFEVKVKGLYARLWLIDKEGKKQDAKEEGFYGFAFNGKLYINHYHNFYEIEKRSNGFYFYGTPTPDSNTVIFPTESDGSLGSSTISGSSTHQSHYKIDMHTGAAIDIGIY